MAFGNKMKSAVEKQIMKPSEPVKVSAPAAPAIPEDKMAGNAVGFISGISELKVKIPGLKGPDGWMPLPSAIYFKQNRYTSTNKYITGILRRTEGVIEIKG